MRAHLIAAWPLERYQLWLVYSDGTEGAVDLEDQLATRPLDALRDVPRIVDWYMDGKIRIDEMITHTMPLADINRAFDLMHSGESIRSVVTF